MARAIGVFGMLAIVAARSPGRISNCRAKAYENEAIPLVETNQELPALATNGAIINTRCTIARE